MIGFTSKRFAFALLATSALIVPSLAQAQVYQAQKYRAVDANGVDVTWGDFVMNFVERRWSRGRPWSRLLGQK